MDAEQILGLGKMTASLMETMQEEGAKIAESLGEDFEVDDISVTFDWQPNGKSYKLTLAEVKES